MRTIRRLIYAEVLKSVAFVALGFLALFFFFDFIDELSSIGRADSLDYGVPQALLYVALLVPSHLYELLPIAVLIGVNVVFGFLFPGIAWQAHLGGLVTGAIVAFGYTAASRRRRGAGGRR